MIRRIITTGCTSPHPTPRISSASICSCANLWSGVSIGDPYGSISNTIG